MNEAGGIAVYKHRWIEAPELGDVLLIRESEAPTRVYNPMSEEPLLFQDFAGLRADAGPILSFAETYGDVGPRIGLYEGETSERPSICVKKTFPSPTPFRFPSVANTPSLAIGRNSRSQTPGPSDRFSRSRGEPSTPENCFRPVPPSSCDRRNTCSSAWSTPKTMAMSMKETLPSGSRVCAPSSPSRP